MIKAIRQIFSRKPGIAPARPLPAIPAGQRVYAIGDVHGRLDLLMPLFAAIEADDAARGPADTTLIMLGDLVDRGPDSSATIDAVRAMMARRKVRVLCGNHEEMFLDGLEDPEILRHFLRFGGRETVLSYPVDLAEYREMTIAETRELLHRIIPAEHIALMRDAEDMIVIGDYLFVHAGIRPGLGLSEQKVKDLRWIRDPFLSSRADHGWCVVHGHTIFDEPDVQPNRIGIDTGAYQSGCLTALALEGTQRWFIATDETDGQISVTARAA